MPDRVVTVRLQLASEDFQNGMLQAGSSVRVLQDGLANGTTSADDASESLDSLATIAVGAGAGMMAAFTGVIAVGAKFDQQMSSTGAAAKANADDLQLLRDAALEAGAATSFGATDAAAAEEELAKAGISVADMVHGGLQGALSLAAAGSLDVADAAEIGATALSTFELSGQDMTHVADLLAAGAGKAQGSVDDLGQAMKQSALVSHQLGISIDDQVGTLAEFASAGLTGSDAGTSLRTMLLRLNPQSKEAAQLMDELGLSAYDAQGNFVGMEKYAGILQDGLADLTDEQKTATLNTIFGQDAIRAATVLYQGGAQGVRDWTNAVNDQGYATEVAAAKTDNLAGDIERLRGSIETGLIQASEGGASGLRTLTQHITQDVNALATLPPAVSQVGTVVLGGTGALLTMGGASMLLYGRLGNLSTRLLDVATTPGQRFTGAMGAMSRGVGLLQRSMIGLVPVVAVAAIAFDFWAQKQAKNNAAVATLAQTLDATTGAITASTRATAQKTLEDEDAARAAQELGISQATLVDAALGQKDALSDLDGQYQTYLQTLRQSGDWSQDQLNTYHENVRLWELIRKVLKDTGGDLSAARAEWERLNSSMVQGGQATAEAAAKQDAASTALDGTTVSMKNQTDAATILKDAIDNLSGKAVSAEQANLSLQSGLNQMANTVAGNAAAYQQAAESGDALALAQMNGFNSLTLLNPQTGIYTSAVVANRQAVVNAIQQSNQHTQAVYDQTQSVDQATAALDADQKALMATALAAGLNKDEVQKLLDTYALNPRSLTTYMYAETDQALADVQELKRWTDLLQDKTITINRDIVTRYAGGLDYYGQPTARAGGGPVSAGQLYMTGERGRELFVPATDGYIVDAGRTSQLMTPVPAAAGSVGGAAGAGLVGLAVTIDAGSVGTLTGFVASVSDHRIVASRNGERLAGVGGPTSRPS